MHSDELEEEPVTVTSEDGLLEYDLAEIGKHKMVDEGIWVTFDGNVYDITEFVEGHPGGNDHAI